MKTTRIGDKLLLNNKENIRKESIFSRKKYINKRNGIMSNKNILRIFNNILESVPTMVS